MPTTALAKIRSHAATVRLGLFDGLPSDAEWATRQGHRIYRVLFHDSTQYWVKDLQGRISTHLTMNDARRDIDWLVARGR